MTPLDSPPMPSTVKWLKTLLPKLPFSLQQKVVPFARAVDRELANGDVDNAHDLASTVLDLIEEEMAYGA